MKKNWKGFFNSFSLYRTSLIQENYIETIIKFTPKKGKILELACGSGLSSVLMADLGYEVTATDTDDDLLEAIKSKFGSMKNLTIRKCDMMQADQIYSKEFNSIIHQGVLEHFDDDEIVEILKRQKNIADLVIFDVPNDKRKEKIQEFGNERFLSIDHWKSLIKRAGCTLIYMDGRRFEGVINQNKYSLSIQERIEYGTSTTFVIKSNAFISGKLHYGCGTVYLDGWFNVDARTDFLSGDKFGQYIMKENMTTPEKYYKNDFKKIIRSDRKTIVDMEATMDFLSSIFDSYFTEVIMYHVLEHIPQYRMDDFINNLKQISSKDAVFNFAVPDNVAIAKLYVNAFDAGNSDETITYHSWIYGKQRDEFCHHFTGYDKNSFYELLIRYFEYVEFLENGNDYPALWARCKNKK